MSGLDCYALCAGRTNHARHARRPVLALAVALSRQRTRSVGVRMRRARRGGRTPRIHARGWCQALHPKQAQGIQEVSAALTMCGHRRGDDVLNKRPACGTEDKGVLHVRAA